MSALWIIIIGFSTFSTLLLFGLVLWWHRKEQQENINLSQLREAKKEIDKRKDAESINELLSKAPFPLYKYASDIETRSEVEKILDDVIIKLKQYEKKENHST